MDSTTREAMEQVRYAAELFLRDNRDESEQLQLLLNIKSALATAIDLQRDAIRQNERGPRRMRSDGRAYGCRLPSQA